MVDRSSFAPLVFLEYDHEPGTYCLILADRDMVEVMDVFEECGQYGNGYGWQGVAMSALQAHAPALTDRIEFDSEAGTFVAFGKDAEALKTLGALLQGALHDRAVIRDLIESGDPDWFD